MTNYFRHQLALYVEYHRDPWNCAAHVLGILTLFLAAILPLTLWPLAQFGGHITVATVMVLPVLAYWLVLDPAIGLAILGAVVLLLSIAVVMVAYMSVLAVWVTSAILLVLGVSAQAVGHRLFERRQPSMADHPTHFLLGPPFVMAKLFVVLGFRRDLAAIIGPIAAPARASNPGNR